MAKQFNLVFRKTEKGAAEIKSRADNLPARARAALILVNGCNTVEALRGNLGPDAESILQVLLARGHIEALATEAAQVKTPSPARAAPLAATAGAVAPSGDAEIEALLAPLRKHALELLVVHYGPDTPTIAAPLLNARTLKAYLAALDALQDKMEIYLGRKMAIKTLADLRPSDPAR
jgi:hypothetical protein